MKGVWLSTGAGVMLASVASAVALAVPLASTRGGASGQPSNAEYARLWLATHVGQSEAAVLARWPKNPYQHYSDGQGHDCYEWADRPSGRYRNLPAHLYNLCFKRGVLRLKTVF